MYTKFLWINLLESTDVWHPHVDGRILTAVYSIPCNLWEGESKQTYCKLCPNAGRWNFGSARTALIDYLTTFFFPLWCCDPTRAMSSLFLRFLDHTQRRTTVGRTPLDKHQLVAETSTWQHTKLATDIHVHGGIRAHNLTRRAAADPRLRRRDHWDRQLTNLLIKIQIDITNIPPNFY
jgi:hypothetical protein